MIHSLRFFNVHTSSKKLHENFMKTFLSTTAFIMIHRHKIVKHYSSENRKGRISHMRNPAFPLWLPVPDVYRTFFVNLSEEITDTIAAIHVFMAA
jgi:hypothetical protein